MTIYLLLLGGLGIVHLSGGQDPKSRGEKTPELTRVDLEQYVVRRRYRIHCGSASNAG